MIRIPSSGLFAIILLVTISSCGGGGGGGNDVGVTQPTVTPTPDNSATINASALIIFTFSTTMNPSTLTLTGSMAIESNGGAWSTSTNTNDTLTISPLSAWSEAAHTLIINVANTAGVAIASSTLNYMVDATLPVASVVPGNGSLITGSESIVITFSETMDTSMLTASGNLWTNGDGGIWSANSNANDTLTIGPASTWPAGTKDLTLDIVDLAGNLVATLNLNYGVDLTSPNGIAAPVNNGTLDSAENIVISFDKSMDPTSNNYAGSLISEIGSNSWSTTTNPNDTLTISPTSAWTGGAQTLDVTATDEAGNPTTLNLSYTVSTANCSDGIKNQDETDVDCGGSTCSACATGLSCNINIDCSSTSCTLGVCKELNGQSCIDNAQCSSDSCTDTLCCNTACTGTCQACDMSGNLGTCNNYSSGTDPESECPGLSCVAYYHGWVGDSCYRKANVTASAASCDGTGACRSAVNECSASGPGSVAVTCDSLCQDPNLSTCSGTTAGACTNVNPGNQSCGLGICSVTVAQCTNGSPNACVPNAAAAITEICGNGIDDDCDGIIDTDC